MPHLSGATFEETSEFREVKENGKVLGFWSRKVETSKAYQGRTDIQWWYVTEWKVAHIFNGVTPFEFHIKRKSKWDLLKVFYFASCISVGISLGFYFSTKKKKNERKSLAKPEESEHLSIRCKTMNCGSLA